MKFESSSTVDVQNCALCQTIISSVVYSDNDLSFCCLGCQAVYQILLSQNALDRFQEHPIFREALQAGLISNSTFNEKIAQEKISSQEVKKIHFEITEMWCPSCALLIRLILLREPGVVSCVVDYATDLACVEYEQRHMTEEKIFRRIGQLGYRPKALQDVHEKTMSRSLILRFGIAAFCALNVMMFSYPIYASFFESDAAFYVEWFAWLSFASSLPVITYCAWPIWQRFFHGLRVGIWGMETLIVIGVSAAFGISVYELVQGTNYIYFDTLTVIIAFVLLGKMIESKAKFSAKKTLFQLARALPKRGRKLFEDHSERFVPLKEIEVGENIVVLSGEKIVLDGIVTKGEGSCDEALLTGESSPLLKQVGSLVLSGSIVLQGRLVIKVTARPQETVLHRIVEMVEKDIGHKTPYLRAADPIVKWFIPIVVGLALATGIYCYVTGTVDGNYSSLQTGLLRAFSVLLISCPCAIGIAAPMVESYLLNALAGMGAIVRNRGCLQYLGRETIFIFDKTGTITEGKFTVLAGLERLSFRDKQILKGLVMHSNHPISIALNQSLLCNPIELVRTEELIGKGLKGTEGDNSFILGSRSFLQEEGVQTIVEDNESISSKVYFAKNKEWLTEIQFGDRLRTDAKETIESFKGVSTYLVSGDSCAIVKQLATICGFSHWQAEVLPWQKRDLIQSFKKKKKSIVGFIGDGINDAPALTMADVGIAVVNATDISIQVSDILLTSDKLSQLGRIRQLANRARKIIKQNLFWAFFYNVIGICLAMLGMLSPLFAVFAMMASSLMVLLNAKRC